MIQSVFAPQLTPWQKPWPQLNLFLMNPLTSKILWTCLFKWQHAATQRSLSQTQKFRERRAGRLSRTQR